jgi:acylphosphatase
MATYHLIIKGEVQGVFYRDSARKEATRLGVMGWIKNKPNGDVEGLVQGQENLVHQFIEWCKQGPPRARVTNVIINKKEDQEFDSFTVL